MFKKIIRRLAIAMLAGLILIQFFTVRRHNPETHATTTIPPHVEDILRRACFDCHSNRVQWPWYSAVAPLSWVISDHVNEGREELNFSQWDLITAHQRGEWAHESLEEIEEGEMPLWDYLLLHPQAQLNEGDQKLLNAWLLQQSIRQDERREQTKDNETAEEANHHS